MLGIDLEAIHQIKSDIVTASNNTDVLDPPFALTPVDTAIDDKNIIYIRIPVSSQVHKHRGITYDRENDSDIRIRDHARISEIYHRKSNHFSELEIYPALTMGDLNIELFSTARKLIRSRNPDHIWLNEDDQGFLRLSNLYRRDFRTGDEGLTLACALILGKDDIIQSILPAYRIEALVRKENMDRWDDRLSLRTNLIDSYKQLIAFVKNHLPEKFYLEGEQRKDLRELIFREVIANILIHREYTLGEPTQLIIYKGKVESTNPNIPHFRGTVLLDEFHPFPKNPTISKFFSEIGWVEELGSGVKNLFRYVPQYAKGAKPYLLEDNTFITTIPLEANVLDNRYKLVLSFLSVDESDIPQNVIAQLKRISINPELAGTENDDQFLFDLVSSWAGKSTKLPDLRLVTGDELPDFDRWLVPSSSQKGTKLFGKRFTVLMKILVGVFEEISMDELMTFMDYKNRAQFRKLYINPLLNEGLIKRTIPEKPKAPKQKYVVTEKATYLLGGFDI